MKHNFNDIVDYVRANIRHAIYHSRFVGLLPDRISRQFEARVMSMDNKCYEDGSCKECGCMTTHLQMTNKPCEGGCYPKMLNSAEWNQISNEGRLLLQGEGKNKKFWYIRGGKFKSI